MKWNGEAGKSGKPGNTFSVIQVRDNFAFTKLMRMNMERNGWPQEQFKCAACMEVRGLRKTVQEMTLDLA